MEVPVHQEAISVIAQYWDNQLRCFVLPGFNISLVMEEYTSFLRHPLRIDSAVYLFPGHLPSHREVASLFGRPVTEIPFAHQGQSQSVPLKYILQHMETLRLKGDWIGYNRILALAVYGIILFPFASKTVDLAAISVFLAVEHHRVNPIPAILADTFMSLSHCRVKGGRLKCCLQLLSVWLTYHFLSKDHPQASTLDYPLRDFKRKCQVALRRIEEEKNLSLKSHDNWNRFFQTLSAEEVKWKIGFWSSEEVLYSCGDYSNVMLMGPRGIINYNPSLAHSQLAYVQDIPPQELLQSLMYLHSEQSENMRRQVADAWKFINFKGKIELGKRGIKPTADFEEWRIQKLMRVDNAEESTPRPLQGNDLRQIEQALRIKIEEHKVELENLQAEKKRKAKDVSESQKEYVEIRRDIAGLQGRGEIAELKEENQRLKEKIAELHHARRVRDSELHKETLKVQAQLSNAKAEIRGLREETAQIRVLESQIITLSARVEELQVREGENARAVAELKQARDMWMEEARFYRGKHLQTAHFINQAVPDFAQAAREANVNASVLNTPKAVEDFIALGLDIVNRWNSICKDSL